MDYSPHVGVKGAAPLRLCPEDVVADAHSNLLAACAEQYLQRSQKRTS